MRSFTKSNARHNLTVLTGRIPLTSQAHHTMPVKFATAFERAGINIHDPIYLLWWCSDSKRSSGSHQRMARAYNKDWQDFFDSFKGKNPTKTQILNKRSSLVTKYAAGYICGAV